MKNIKFRERLQGYETAIKEACDICNHAIEHARQDFLKAKRSARRIRDEAITKIRQEFES